MNQNVFLVPCPSIPIPFRWLVLSLSCSQFLAINSILPHLFVVAYYKDDMTTTSTLE